MYRLLFMESLWDTMCFRCGARTMTPFYIETALNQKVTCTYDEMWKSVLIQTTFIIESLCYTRCFNCAARTAMLFFITKALNLQELHGRTM